MTLSEALLPEFDREMANTRKTLERVPEDKFGWKPHEKSMLMGDLASHLALLPGWVVNTINQDSLDLAPPGEESDPFAPASSRQELLEMFDKNVVSARDSLTGVSDEHLLKSWTLLVGGKQILSRPRIAVLRDFVMSHTIHHRAQLGVYLRLNDVPVPAIYGPSADEEGMPS
jgi:uncharacterized damage-inducible protein DinB